MGVAVDGNEREDIARSLGPESKVLMLLNHGVVTLGNTPDEALFYLNNLVNACEFQIDALALGLDNVIVPDINTVQNIDANCSQLDWARGELEWEAEMRKLDMLGCRTGQIYKTSSLIHSAANRL
jgi:adducin